MLCCAVVLCGPDPAAPYVCLDRTHLILIVERCICELPLVHVVRVVFYDPSDNKEETGCPPPLLAAVDCCC